MKILAAVLAAVLLFAGCAQNADSAHSESVPQSTSVSSAAPASSESIPLPSREPVDRTVFFQTIAELPEGTAGSSLALAGAAAEMIRFSAEAGAFDDLAEYFDALEANDRAAFAAQWQYVQDFADSIFSDFENCRPMLADCGHEDFDPDDYSADAYTQFTEYVYELFHM